MHLKSLAILGQDGKAIKKRFPQETLIVARGWPFMLFTAV